MLKNWSLISLNFYLLIFNKSYFLNMTIHLSKKYKTTTIHSLIVFILILARTTWSFELFIFHGLRKWFLSFQWRWHKDVIGLVRFMDIQFPSYPLGYMCLHFLLNLIHPKLEQIPHYERQPMNNLKRCIPTEQAEKQSNWSHKKCRSKALICKPYIGQHVLHR
jgi:hypothetical protein